FREFSTIVLLVRLSFFGRLGVWRLCEPLLLAVLDQLRQVIGGNASLAAHRFKLLTGLIELSGGIVTMSGALSRDTEFISKRSDSQFSFFGGALQLFRSSTRFAHLISPRRLFRARLGVICLRFARLRFTSYRLSRFFGLHR